ncbi:hypothetical protein ACLLKL_001934 [Escherichia coli]
MMNEKQKAKRREYTRQHRAKMRELDRSLRVTMEQVYARCGIVVPPKAPYKDI